MIFFALFGLWVTAPVAQPTLQFQNFTQQDGLSSNYVLSILQDHQGFVWVGTENGLNRFDGRHFLSFGFDPEDPETLSDDWIWTILEDSQHQLWIGTQRGLNLLNRESGKIERVPLVKDGQVIKTAIIKKVQESVTGSLWVATLNQGLFKLEKDQKWQALHFAYGESTMEDEASVKPFNVAHETSNELWVVHSAGIDQIHIPSQKMSRYPFLGAGISFTGDFYGSLGLYDGKGNIFVGFQNELFVLDTSEDKPVMQTFRAFDYGTNITAEPFFDRPNVLFFPSDNNLALFNLQQGTLDLIQEEGQVSEDLFRNPVHAAFKDRQGNYWVGTAGGGLHLGQKVKNAFTFYQHDPTNPNSISNGQVRTFLEDKNKGLWVGIIDHGLDYFIPQEDKLLKRSKSVIAVNGQPNPLASNKVIKIIPGEKGSIWMATNDSGLIKTDATGKTLETFTHQPRNPNSLSANRIWGLAKDEYGYIWAGTWQDGLNRLDPRTKQVKRFRHDPANPNSLVSNNIRNIFIDKQGILWIGTENGLTRFDSNREQFTNFRHDPEDPNSLSNDLVWAVYEDRHGALWMGTNTGLNLYDPSTQQFERFYEKDGLPDNSIYGILEDDAGLLWISTPNGLACQLASGSNPPFRSLFMDEGLPTTSFLPKAYLNSAASDQLFFGSAEGMLVLRPARLPQDSGEVQLAIHEMKRFKRRVARHAVTADFFVSSHSQTVHLGYQDQSVTFTLSDLNWMDHPTYSYEYQLVGFNKQWTPLEENMQVSFSNLPAGKYILRARAKNLENINLEATELLTLRVLPPWWRSGVAYLVYLLMLVGLSLIFVRSYLRRQLEKKEVENLKALDEFKNKLFTNITHELRTPLTIISGMNEQIQKKPGRWLEEGSSLIRKNTDNLLDLINQILELQKAESGNLRVKMQQADIIPLLRNIFDQFQAYARSKEQRLIFIQKEDKLDMDYDPEKILRIVSNLLSNAIKYTPERGEVTLQVSSETDSSSNTGQCLVVTVKDDGPGIPQEQLPNIFNRFFQASANGQTVGSGIGLSLTRELVKLLDGNIVVDSQLGQGTTFKVYLPIKQQAPRKEAADLINVRKTVFGRAGHVNVGEGTANDDLPLALIVEDNPDIAQYLQLCLEESYQLEVTTDGQAGIDKALEIIPDIIISDVMMPKKDGFEVCETLKEDIRTSHIPLILLTAKSDVESRIIGLKQGADDYLGKPFHEEELLVRMQNLLKIRQRLQERYQDLYAHPSSANKAQLSEKEDAFILKLKAVFEDHMGDSTFDLESLSKELHLSRSQLGRKVKALTGRSPARFIRSLRVQKARHLLLTSELSVKEIAYQVGFTTPAYFSTSYSEEFGETPRETALSRQMRK